MSIKSHAFGRVTLTGRDEQATGKYVRNIKLQPGVSIVWLDDSDREWFEPIHRTIGKRSEFVMRVYPRACTTASPRRWKETEPASECTARDNC